jgi:hypothetical protein
VGNVRIAYVRRAATQKHNKKDFRDGMFDIFVVLDIS